MRVKQTSTPNTGFHRNKKGRLKYDRNLANVDLSLPPLSKLRRVTRQLLTWFERNARDLPWRRTQDPYAIWISEVMLQQTQVNTVIPYWERWLKAFPDVHSLARARLQRVLKKWEGLGYYRRARNLLTAAQKIVRQHQGMFPSRFQDVLALPGVGRYTAGAVCSIAFNQPAPILDGNVRRGLTRRFGLHRNAKRALIEPRLWLLSEALVRQAAAEPGARNCGKLNQALMELGALICVPRNPECAACPVALHCVARQGKQMEEFSPAAVRPTILARRFAAFILEEKGRFLVRQRPATGVNAGLWEFPNSEVKTDASLDCLAREILGQSSLSLHPMMVLQHAITRFRITLEVFRVETSRAPKTSVILSRRRLAATGCWLSLRALNKLPFTAAHHRILEQLDGTISS
jgi:A/G-specific adenine glycosylase